MAGWAVGSQGCWVQAGSVDEEGAGASCGKPGFQAFNTTFTALSTLQFPLVLVGGMVSVAGHKECGSVCTQGATVLPAQLFVPCA